MPHPLLHILDDAPRIPFEPLAIEVFRHDPKLNDKVAREVLGFGFAALLSPETEQSRLISAHDDTGV
jgi:hypothetical protein